MQRYYFHVRKGEHTLDEDTEGQMLSSSEAAEATAGQISRQLGDEPDTYGGYSVVVMDEDGRLIVTVPIIPS